MNSFYPLKQNSEQTKYIHTHTHNAKQMTLFEAVGRTIRWCRYNSDKITFTHTTNKRPTENGRKTNRMKTKKKNRWKIVGNYNCYRCLYNSSVVRFCPFQLSESERYYVLIVTYCSNERMAKKRKTNTCTNAVSLKFRWIFLSMETISWEFVIKKSNEMSTWCDLIFKFPQWIYSKALC